MYGRSDKLDLILLINIIIVGVKNFQQTGALSCHLSNGQEGICTRIQECRSGTQLPSDVHLCNFKGQQVCCVNSGAINQAKNDETNKPLPSLKERSSISSNGKLPWPNVKNSNGYFILPGSDPRKPSKSERPLKNSHHLHMSMASYHNVKNNFNNDFHRVWGEKKIKRTDRFGHGGMGGQVYHSDLNEWHAGRSQNHNSQMSTTRRKRMRETTTPRSDLYFDSPVRHSETKHPSSDVNLYGFPDPSARSPPWGTRSSFEPESRGRMRMSEIKCLEYSKEITENVTGLPLTTNPEPVVIPVRKCVHAQQLIVGGENTTLGEFPHMAAIGFRNRNKSGIAWNCGGTLISDQYILTAAHCTSTSSGSPVKVRLGEYNLLKNDDGAYPVDYTVAGIITHPLYKPPSKYHDVALLKLSRRVKFYKHIRPACLYSEHSLSSPKAIATGWGRTYYGGGVSEILQKVILSIVDNDTCNRLYRNSVKAGVLSRGITDTQLCAGELAGGKDTCQGDSGGPLSITNTKCIHHVIGITSFGKSCALPNSTGVYTRVSAYVPWIESIVWK